MSSLHLPSSFFDPNPKSQAIRNRRSFLLATCLIGTALIFTLLVNAASFHPVGSAIALQETTSLQVRADYPVSTYVYERGFFSWFIGIAGSAVVGAAIAFSSIGPTSVAAIANSRAATTELQMRRQIMIYMEPVDKSSKREIDPVEQFFSELYGVDNYRFHGRITEADTFNRYLVAQNNGEHVPVFNFTSPQGIRFHHAMVYKDDGTIFHRFGLPAPPAARSRRTTIYAKYADNEYFTSGGLDALDSGGLNNGNDQYLNTGDYSKMQTELHCADSSLTSLGEFGVQVYDATTQETIGFATIAPV
ncbi:hypothetical protein N7474_006046 [Penicillium riverlandense]|uniref:uncharacterized protein n=1 Tax=Penicillium riverlandense TaxID=1903569 RepID=UPI002547500E|nr:uncharacterized protein N7474_006046 [Penicillium riverlandense]KAJ5820455.1 hypothetical protein N7474_006046 [Penicillium riverlandense]